MAGSLSSTPRLLEQAAERVRNTELVPDPVDDEVEDVAARLAGLRG